MSPQNQPVSVLIVDDRMDGLIALEAVLGRIPGVSLVKAQSGQEALDLLPEYNFALILLDVQMPEMDGFQTANRIREFPGCASTPILFVTAINNEDHYVQRGYEAGAVDYIFKPFDPNVLRSKACVFIELHRKSELLKAQAEMIRESERRERYLRLTELEVESLKRYRNLADAIPHMVWRARTDGSLDYFNANWTAYTGLMLEESVGIGWQKAIHPDDLGLFLRIWMKAMSTHEAFELECRILRHDGEARWHWIRAVSEEHFSGGVIAWLGTCTDIHDRKLTEEKLIEAERAANLANSSKTNFLANMSHEIRTPMNAILGFTELMLDPEQSLEDRMSCISIVHRNGRQLLKIIDEILDISKVESGRLEVEHVDVNITSMLSDIRSLLQLSASEKGLLLEFSCRTPFPNIVRTDPTRMRQVLLNIIGNAIKFTERGLVKVDIGWEDAGAAGGRLLFWITDTGMGIIPSQTHRLFKPFSQIDASTTRHFGGTGLGLALSRRLARALGGDVDLESSTLGVGSTFRVTFTVSIVSGAEYLKRLETAPEFSNSSGPVQSENLAGLDILLVEDLEENRELVERILTQAGASVETADNGEEGVRKALAGDFDIVLMDIQMPLLDGYAATMQLRAQGYRTPIIALTAHALKEERDRCLDAGCDSHLTKPIQRKTLIEQVRRAAQHARGGDLGV
ncbi:MAG: response regulator [Bdellovibrionales bacterium]